MFINQWFDFCTPCSATTTILSGTDPVLEDLLLNISADFELLTISSEWFADCRCGVDAFGEMLEPQLNVRSTCFIAR
ncbi:hypothetical protein [Tateyamaria sp. SN3-11]|uniref:hypothetical protein n=1 Tax=Tateyamaria sp. SN3-11 TaxID=3092147 RepID=UPI0039EC669E